MIALDFRKKDPTASGSAVSSPEQRQDAESTDEGWIVCRACARRIAHQKWIVDAGSHAPLIFSNPHGHAFHLILVSHTDGMRHDQVFTTEHTWFSGYEWSIGICQNCGSHVGWEFRAARSGLGPQSFAALSRDRVRWTNV